MTFDFLAFLKAQTDFSDNTFGPGQRTTGVIAHIRKELEEILQEPDDLVEWIDVVLLSLDGARRAGHSLFDLAAAWPGGSFFDSETRLHAQFDLARSWFGESAAPAGVVPLIEERLAHLETHPGDLGAWLGVTSLAFEGGRRASGTPAKLLETLEAKLARNQQRTWPDWRTHALDEPMQHDPSLD